MSSMPNRSNLRTYSRRFGTCLQSPNRCSADEANRGDFAAPAHVGFWHFATIRVTRKFGRYWGGIADLSERLVQTNSVENDPSPTLVVHCSNGFDVRFEPYQSTRLSRYNAG